MPRAAEAAGAAAGPVPWFGEAPQPYTGPFRTNVHQFLRAHGTKVALGLRRVSAWYVPLTFCSRQGGSGGGAGSVHLHVYEERLDEGETPICDLCRHSGEGRVRHRQLHHGPCGERHAAREPCPVLRRRHPHRATPRPLTMRYNCSAF